MTQNIIDIRRTAIEIVLPMITDLHPAECCSVSPAVCHSAAPPSFGAFLVGSEQPSGAARHRRPPREGGPHYSPKTG